MPWSCVGRFAAAGSGGKEPEPRTIPHLYLAGRAHDSLHETHLFCKFNVVATRVTFGKPLSVFPTKEKQKTTSFPT